MKMKNLKQTLFVLTMALTFMGSIAKDAVAGQPVIEGMVGLDLEEETGFLAIRVEVPEAQALNGVLWYNNDEDVIFPHLFVGAGFENGPGLIENAVIVGEQINGGSLSWSEVVFDDPVGATLGGLYVMFQFPGTPYSEAGEGGGPAIGYSSESDGSLGWISGGGESWASLHPAYGFSILPVFVPYTEGMTLKSLNGGVEIVELEEEVEEFYLTIGPNPFNPRTDIRFGLPVARQVRLDIFDLRGRRVNRLVDDFLQSGHHVVPWLGKDGDGRSVASGVYLMKMTVDSESFTGRLTLVR